MSAMSDVFLCGGDCVEDVNRSECHLRESPEVRIPTSHTIGRAIKELSHEDLEYKSSSGNVFRFNTNPRLNDLLMKLNMKMGLFKSGQTVNVDFDHVFVKTEKADAKYSYKQAYGYFPGVVSIDGIIAYIENRDGKLAEDILFVGSQIPMANAQGQRMLGVVKEIGDDTVKMDFNHPMAGKTLNFDVEVVSVRDVTPEDLQGGCSCGDCGDDCGGGCDHGDGHCDCH